MLKVYKPVINFDSSKLKRIDKKLPLPPFRIVLCGPTNCGKTNMVKNFLFNQSWGYNKYFQEFYVWCASLDDLIEYKILARNNKMDERFCFAQVYKDDDVKELITSIEKDNIEKENEEKVNVMTIFDDQITNNITSRSKLNSLDTIFVRGRHFGVSCLISTQKYRSLSSNVRQLNCSHVVVFEGTNMTDLQAIAEEHSGSRTKDEMLKILQDNLKEKFDFIIINNREHIIQNKQFEKIS